ncbi:protein moonraker isoform X2 [Nothoprocta perdicaria]|uniref:protein moonraker isoform X2 n=1 Tax=Nothoprocta perdicaria TaxID=30464 RepID=UPI000E1BBB35|nr:protein moonraker isoform X2 [Nothoprocta perdicaria]
MGPSKPSTSGITFASDTPRFRNEATVLQTQLQFNKNVPAVPENLSVRFPSPHPIIIEKLKPSKDQRSLAASDDPSIRSSGMFSVISEEKLKFAIQLAKRDVRQRHCEGQVKQQVFGVAVNKQLLAKRSQQHKNELFQRLEEKNASNSWTTLKCQHKLGQPSKVKTSSPSAKLSLYTPNEGRLIPSVLGSPPIHDPGPGSKKNIRKKDDENIQEVRRLQKELRSCIQKIEEMSKKKRDEILDPGEEQRIRIRRQEQTVQSARKLYVLQQQVKEIQDNLDKLSPHKIKHTKKSQTVSRLAAAHRGAIRALQTFANQFTDQREQVPTHYKELGSLIRQLSLCSAKLEMDSFLSDTIIDILLQVEDLDSLLEKKQTPKKTKKCLSAFQGKSPGSNMVFPARTRLRSPRGEKKPLILKKQLGQEPRKPSSTSRLLIDKHEFAANVSAVQKTNSHVQVPQSAFQEENDPPTPEKNAILQGSLDALARAGAVKKGPMLESGPLRKKRVLLPAKSKGVPKPVKSRWVQPQGKRAHFQETTVAFQLKESKRQIEEDRIPRVPPNHTSPSASAKCTVKTPRNARSSELIGNSTSHKRKAEGRRLSFTEKEAPRSQGASPIRFEEKVERTVQEHLEPLLDKAQVATNADKLTEKLLDDLLEDTVQELWSMEQQERLQTPALAMAECPSLEAMLQKMEDIERYQEAVRRRLTQIVYSDLEFWAQEEKKEQQNVPSSPHPIQITRLIGQKEPEIDIIFENPFNSNGVDEIKTSEEKLQPGSDILQTLSRSRSLPNECYVSLSVPKAMFQNLLDYNNRYKHHLKIISHEAIGSFNPWQIAESLAEELTEEALCDVAAELQNVCEDYAEAVFTSEFLQPT